MREVDGMRKVALVMPYYGVLPSYFNFFLRSLEGKILDVLFFSDLAVGKYPENFKQITMSFDEFKCLAEKKLGIPVRIESPKRLCDFKPMYGKIFEDYLSDYSWWAFGDCDLVYGNGFNALLTEVEKSDADVFSLEKMFCCGPLCFVRNTPANNVLFKNAKGWIEVAKSLENVIFDEIGGDWFDELRKGKITLADCARRAPSFSAAVMLSDGVKFDYREVMEQCELNHGEVVRCNGSSDLSLDGKPICIYHYIRSKQRKYFTFVPSAYEDAQDFVIDDAGFYVTPCQKTFRFFVNRWRKFKAAARSLRKNGLARLSPKWRRQFRPET